MTTDEQKLGVIAQAIYEWMSYPDHDGIKSTNDIESVSKDILASLKQFDQEPLDVDVFKTIGSYRVLIPNWFPNKQSAVEFCAKHGLRVKK